MICGTLGRFAGPLPEPLARALSFLERENPGGLDPGRYALEGEALYAVVDETGTGPFDEGQWEAHRRYVDVQCLLEGEEWIGWAPDEGALPVQDGLDEEDCLYFAPPPAPTWIHLVPGRFAVFFPDDLHCPLRAPHRAPVKKVVVKVALDFFKEER